jgi:5-methylcytosine-specific restriction endonuclease McrA
MPIKPQTHYKTIKRRLDRGRTKDRFYDSPAWRALRREKLTLCPLCEICKAEGRITVATEVHHLKERRDHPELALSMSNLQSLCKSCHSRLSPSTFGNRNAK